MERRPEVDQLEEGLDRPLGLTPVLKQLAHLDGVRDAPVLGPSAHVFGAIDKRFRVWHTPMLHPGGGAGCFGLSWRQTQAGVAKLVDARDFQDCHM